MSVKSVWWVIYDWTTMVGMIKKEIEAVIVADVISQIIAVT